MSWRWVPDRQPAEPLTKTFATQGEAESWLGEFYPDLLDSGVHFVSLYEESRLVYGPMGLEPEVG